MNYENYRFYKMKNVSIFLKCSMCEILEIPEKIFSKENRDDFLNCFEYLGASKVKKNWFGESGTLPKTRKLYK